MPLVTAGDLISLAFRTSGINGVGQSSSADDSTDALALLNMMMAQWQRRRWLVWDLTETVLVSTGATTYSLMPGGDFPIVRTDRLENAFARFLNSTSAILVDFPLTIIDSREDYNSIALKTMQSVPAGVYYDNGYPNGTLYFWPVPPAGQYELHIFTKSALPTYVGLTTVLGFPPEYIEAALYSLAVRLAMNWGLEPKPSHVAAMRAALNTIRLANLQIPQLSMPPGVARQRGNNGAPLGVGAGIGGAFILNQSTVL